MGRRPISQGPAARPQGPPARPSGTGRQGALRRLPENTLHLDPVGPGHDEHRTAGSGCPQRRGPGVTSPQSDSALPGSTCRVSRSL